MEIEDMVGELVFDSGYQIVCAISSVPLGNAIDWLTEKLGYEFATGEKITNIDNFQFIPVGNLFSCVATCTVHKQNEQD